MVGLPARGKSTLAERLRDGLCAQGLSARVFNNGELRRSLLGPYTADPEFYDPENENALAMRENLSQMNIAAAKKFLGKTGDIAIMDATNASRTRRLQLELSLTGYPILYVECVNSNPEILATNIARKAKMAEFKELSPEKAQESFKKRMGYYQRIYTPLYEESCYVRVDTLKNRIIEEKLDKAIPYYVRIRDILVSEWVRELFLLRHGETEYNVENRIGGDSSLTERGHAQAAALAVFFKDRAIPYIFTSKRKRSLETAKPIIETHPEATHISLPEFDEINAGVCEGMTYEEIRNNMPEEFAARAEDKYNYIYPGGEGYITLHKRVERGFLKALFLSGGLPGIVVIGHQAINRMILSHFLYRRTQDVPYIYVPQDQLFRIIATQPKKLFELISFGLDEGRC